MMAKKFKKTLLRHIFEKDQKFFAFSLFSAFFWRHFQFKFKIIFTIFLSIFMRVLGTFNRKCEGEGNV